MIEAANEPWFAPTFESVHGVLWPKSAPFVPERTYSSIASFQRVAGSHTYGLPAGEAPVVLRGALHCRIERQGPKAYAYRVASRYIQMRRITCLDPLRWQAIVESLRLLLHKPRRHWWSRWYCAWEMVGPHWGIVDGKATGYLDDRQMAMLRKLHAKVRRMN